MVKAGFVSVNLIVILVVALGHTLIHYSVFSAENHSGRTISGFSISEVDAENTGTFSISLLIIGFEWATLIFIMILSFTRQRAVSSNNGNINIDKEKMRKIAKNGTEIDMLYELLRTNHSLKISTVEKLFEADKDKVMSWSKTLVDANLITFNYPSVGEAELIIR